MHELLNVCWSMTCVMHPEAGACNVQGAARMAVEIYRLYMDERLLAQLDWGACFVYFEILLGKGFMEAPTSEAFDVGHCMPWAELSEAEMTWFYSTPRGRAKLACQPPLFEPTVVDVLQREAEENSCAVNGEKPADCLKWSPRQLSQWCGQMADLALKGHIHRFRQ